MNRKSPKADDLQMKKLPLPATISTFKSVSANEQPVDENDGKVRVFPHERGQWSLHTFAAVDAELFCDLKVFSHSYENLKKISQPHVSLNRGYFVTRFHQITSIVESLSKKLAAIPSFFVCLSCAQILENEDKTRVFVSLCDGSTSDNSLHRKSIHLIIESIKSVFSEFASPVCSTSSEDEFLIHSSIMWTTPNFKDEALSAANCINETLEEPFLIEVSEVNAKIGNKMFSFPLKYF